LSISSTGESICKRLCYTYHLSSGVSAELCSGGWVKICRCHPFQKLRTSIQGELWDSI